MSLLPPNATTLERALEGGLHALSFNVALRDLKNPTTCPAAWLPWLAWEYGADNWSDAWSIATKREYIRQLTYVKTIRGTRASVEAVIEALGGRVQIREWFERDPMGDPGTFDMVIDLNSSTGAAPSAAFVDSVIAEVNRTKPVSRHYNFTQILRAPAVVGLKAAVLGVIRRRLSLTVPAA